MPFAGTAWRVFPWDPDAAPAHPAQGSGRFDVTGIRVLYLAESAAHAVAEKLQRYRGARIDRHELNESGRPLALVECQVASDVLPKIADLCDPRVLVKHDIGPDTLASRDRARTQRVARLLHDEQFAGLRWWSALSGDWHTIVLFLDRVGASDVRYLKPEQLTLAHEAVKEASAALGFVI